mgnify:CR=1 FL=1
MIGISKLYCGAVEPADVLRYGRQSKELPSHLLQFSADKRPVVVWNVTRRCNLKCIHCYSSSQNRLYPDELTTEEAKVMIADLAAFGDEAAPQALLGFRVTFGESSRRGRQEAHHP